MWNPEKKNEEQAKNLVQSFNRKKKKKIGYKVPAIFWHSKAHISYHSHKTSDVNSLVIPLTFQIKRIQELVISYSWIQYCYRNHDQCDNGFFFFF